MFGNYKHKIILKETGSPRMFLRLYFYDYFSLLILVRRIGLGEYWILLGNVNIFPRFLETLGWKNSWN